MNDLTNIGDLLPVLNDNNIIKLILYGNELFDDNKNQSILMCNIKFIKNLQTFFEALL